MDTRDQRLISLVRKAQEEYSEDNFVYVIPGFMAKKFIAYCAMREDVVLMLEYTQLIHEDHSSIIKSSLTYSIIALYGKCFTDASKNSNPKLEPTSIFEKESPHLLTHEYLMDLRHQFIAHRGNTDSEIGVSFLMIPKEGGLEESQIRFSQLKQVSFSNEDLEKIEAVLFFLRDLLQDKIQKSGEKLNSGYISTFTPEQVNMMMINNLDRH